VIVGTRPKKLSLSSGNNLAPLGDFPVVPLGGYPLLVTLEESRHRTAHTHQHVHPLNGAGKRSSRGKWSE
jgi:hypothetical protein